MIRKFSLYGFLKNQRYFEPFLILAFLDMGLNYTLIGFLIGFREVIINLAEIPSGAIADIYGRRRSMIFSFLAYIASFTLMGITGFASTRGSMGIEAVFALLLVAMLCYAVGDAFRTGTHKAMIFTWLRQEGRIDERTRIYGYTRSWSKIGSAVSVILASLFVLVTRNYVYMFLFSIAPYIVNIVNLLSYPGNLDGEPRQGGIREVGRHLRDSLRIAVKCAPIRRLISESMGFEGFFKAISDYLQPILKAAALPLSAALFGGLSLTDEQSSVILVGPVYLVLYLISAAASRNSHLMIRRPGDEDPAARRLWIGNAVLLLAMTPAMYFDAKWIIIAGFVLLNGVQNIWRPILISRFDSYSDEARGATVLSIESQAKSLATMIFAPLLGALVDTAIRNEWGAGPFWPVGVIGLLIAVLFIATVRKAPAQEQCL